MSVGVISCGASCICSCTSGCAACSGRDTALSFSTKLETTATGGCWMTWTIADDAVGGARGADGESVNAIYKGSTIDVPRMVMIVATRPIPAAVLSNPPVGAFVFAEGFGGAGFIETTVNSFAERIKISSLPFRTTLIRYMRGSGSYWKISPGTSAPRILIVT